METFVQITVWVFSAVVICLTTGFYLRRSTSHSAERRAAQRERQAALHTMVDLLQAVEELTKNVDVRSSQIREVGEQVGGLQVSGEFEQVKRTLLGHITAVLKSNQALHQDLKYARGRVEEQAEEIDRSRVEARTDELSGVNNRKAFDEKLWLQLSALQRAGEPFVLILSDLDHFKWINDTHGHPVGDNVIRQFGQLLRACVRDGDFVGRFGGDEFAVILPRAELDVGLRVAERICAETSHMNFGVGKGRRPTALTCSVGVAFGQVDDTPESVLQRADQALYHSKQHGRNRVQFQQSLESPPPAPAVDQAALTGLTLPGAEPSSAATV